MCIMYRVLALLALLIPACQQAPIHSSAALIRSAAAGASTPVQHSYGAAIVKDLAIGDAPPENLTGIDLANYEAARSELAMLFGASFRETLQREGYVRVALTAESDGDVVVIQPATMRVSPSGLEIAVAELDARGRLIDWYAVQYGNGALPGTAHLSNTDFMRRLFADAGEQVARAIAAAR